jgi:hypothetical protein
METIACNHIVKARRTDEVLYFNATYVPVDSVYGQRFRNGENPIVENDTTLIHEWRAMVGCR